MNSNKDTRRWQILSDPLLWFALAGILIFLLEGWQEKQDEQVIIINLPLVEKLVAQWEAQAKRPPSPQEMDVLIEAHIREEILMREAMRLGLDEGDTIIRRRLAQKMQFILGTEDELLVPDETVLADYYQQNQQRFTTPERFSFRHIYLSDDEAQIARIKAALAAGQDWRGLGKPFMLQREYSDRRAMQLQQIFGQAFMDELRQLEKGKWLPVQSAFGHHLVQLDTHIPAQQIAFAKVKDAVARAWMNDRQKQASDKAWQDLRRAYQIKMQPLDAQ